MLKWAFYQIHKNASDNVDLSLNISDLEIALDNAKIQVIEQKEFRESNKESFNTEFQQAFTAASPKSFLCINYLQQNDDESIELIGNAE